jgi:hypothetical protein
MFGISVWEHSDVGKIEMKYGFQTIDFDIFVKSV